MGTFILGESAASPLRGSLQFRPPHTISVRSFCIRLQHLENESAFTGVLLRLEAKGEFFSAEKDG
jgi:hypothetical protein